MRIKVWNNKRGKSRSIRGRVDTIKGRVKKMIGTMQHKAGRLIGTMQYKAGRLIGNRKMRARGTALQRKGSLQSGLGRAKQKIHNVLSHVRG